MPQLSFSVVSNDPKMVVRPVKGFLYVKYSHNILTKYKKWLEVCFLQLFWDSRLGRRNKKCILPDWSKYMINPSFLKKRGPILSLLKWSFNIINRKTAIAVLEKSKRHFLGKNTFIFMTPVENQGLGESCGSCLLGKCLCEYFKYEVFLTITFTLRTWKWGVEEKIDRLILLKKLWQTNNGSLKYTFDSTYRLYKKYLAYTTTDWTHA